MNGDLVTQLTHLGLNQLEALVYTNLLIEGAGTGYAVGKRIGKQTANVYKAIESLADKGAVVVEDGERNRLVQALPAERFLASLELQFQAQKEQALATLQQVAPTAVKDDRVYTFQSSAALFTQAKAMLADCSEIAVLDLFPAALQAIQPDIEALAERGKRVFVQAYQPVDLPNCEVVVVDTGDAFMPDLFEGEQMNIVVDSTETMLALLSRDLKKIRQAVWSKSVYLSFIMHVGMLREHDVHQILNLDEGDFSYQAIQEIVALDDRFFPSHVPGIRQLMTGLEPN